MQGGSLQSKSNSQERYHSSSACRRKPLTRFVLIYGILALISSLVSARSSDRGSNYGGFYGLYDYYTPPTYGSTIFSSATGGPLCNGGTSGHCSITTLAGSPGNALPTSPGAYLESTGIPHVHVLLTMMTLWSVLLFHAKIRFSLFFALALVSSYRNTFIHVCRGGSSCAQLCCDEEKPTSIDHSESCMAGSNARFYSPWGIAISPTGNQLAVVSEDVRQILRAVNTTTAQVTHLAGSLDHEGKTDGKVSVARFSSPRGLAFTPDGTTLYIADCFNHRIRTLNIATGMVSTPAFTGGNELYFPFGVAVSPDGSKLYIVDQAWSSKMGHGVHVANLGTLLLKQIVGGRRGNADGSPSTASYFNPTSIAIMPDGLSVIIADQSNNRIRNLSVIDSHTYGLAGTGETSYAEGTASQAKFRSPCGVAVMPDGSAILISDTRNHRIRYLDVATRVVYTLAGTGAQAFRDGLGNASTMKNPFSVAVSPDGSFALFTDSYNQVIRKITFSKVTIPWSQEVVIEQTADIDADLDLNISAADWALFQSQYVAAFSSFTAARTIPGAEATSTFSANSVLSTGPKSVKAKLKCRYKDKHRYKKIGNRGDSSGDEYVEDDVQKKAAYDTLKVKVRTFIDQLKARLLAKGNFSDHCASNKLPKPSDPEVQTLCASGTMPQGDLCVACPLGKYKSHPDNSSCKLCPLWANTTSEGAMNKSECMCIPGMYSDQSFSDIEDSYSWWSISTCTECPDDHWCSGGTKVRGCPSVSSSSRSAKALSDCTCKAGYYSTAPLNGANFCSLCDSGYWCRGGTHRESCPAMYSTDGGAKSRYECWFQGVEKLVASEIELFVDVDLNIWIDELNGNKSRIQSCVLQYTNISVNTSQVTTAQYQEKVKFSWGDFISRGARKSRARLKFKISDYDSYFDTRSGDFFFNDEPKLQAMSRVRAKLRAWTAWLKTIYRPRGATASTTVTTTTTTTVTTRTFVSYCSGSGMGSDADTSALYESCGSGMHSNNVTECRACPYGTYKAAADNSSCLPCPANANTTTTGALNLSSCLCNPGWYSAAFFDNMDGSATSTNTCYQCPAKSFCTGGTMVDECPDNSSPTTVRAKVMSDCKCMAGFYSVSPLDADSSMCTPCEQGFFCAGDQLRVSCALNSTSPAQSAVASQCVCREGYYSVGGRCIQCPAGTYKNSIGNSTQCTPCSSGTYSTAAGAVSAAFCTPCPDSNPISAAGASSASSCVCAVGHYSSSAGGVCKPCEAGSYAAVAGLSACTLCPAGKFLGYGFLQLLVSACFSGVLFWLRVVMHGCSADLRLRPRMCVCMCMYVYVQLYESFVAKLVSC
jgi:DNA-binding beta-propeller fold protein YncE